MTDSGYVGRHRSQRGILYRVRVIGGRRFWAGVYPQPPEFAIAA